MPKKKKAETSEQQSARFRAELQKLIDAGELSPTEADANFERVMASVAHRHRQWIDGAEDQENPSSEPSQRS